MMKWLNKQIARYLKDARPPHYVRADEIIAQGNRLEDDMKPILAMDAYRSAAQIAPDYPRVHLNIGNVLLALGKPGEAVASYHEALRLDSQYAYAHFNLGNAMQALHRPQEAISAYQQALRSDPSLVAAHVAMAGVFEETGDIELAISHCQQALATDPGCADAHHVLVRLRLAKQSPEQALSALQLFEACVRPPYASARIPALLADAHGLLGRFYHRQNRLESAESCFRRANVLEPGNPRFQVLLGTLCQSRRNFLAATACFRQALTLDPDCAEALFQLGNALKDQGETQDALVCYRKALDSKPDYVAARWAFVMAGIPASLEPGDDIGKIRSDFAYELAQLDAWFDQSRVESGHRAVGMYPFYLAYQEENNRDLLATYGALCSRLMAVWGKRYGATFAHPSPAPRIRVGIVSAFFFDHSVWQALLKGWLRHLDASRFELLVFHTGGAVDEETAWAKAHVSHYERGAVSLSQWVARIIAQHPHILIYPEIGMDQTSMKLAALRLAPVQAVAWGHPETSGLPTMDYYISAQDFEPPLGQENYTEELVALPHLGCCYYPRSAANEEDIVLEHYGLTGDIPIILCPGTPYKYAPQYDHVLVEIAKRLGKCKFVFFVHSFESLSQKLRCRLDASFTRGGLRSSDHIVFIPWLSRPAFYGLMKKADVMLDTLGFSGFNTAMQAVECGLPIVAWEGRFMRGRLASGILRRIDLPELVARTEDEYIALAVRLIQDAGYRTSIREHMRSAADSLFEDLTPVRALEEFLLRVTVQGPTSHEKHY